MFNNRSLTLLEKSLETASLRQQVISNNIANVNTPGFKRSFVSFEDSLKEAMKSQEDGLSLAVTNADHLRNRQKPENVAPEVVRERNTSLRHDGNNVDLDVEMAQMAMNSINYNLSVTQLSKRFAMLRQVISGGR